ncbi:MAG: hypothetical protein IE909_18455, partial [Campylobacterales bacterium]|nr:hypothetical protein [Campylobacterales bacterium]
MSSTIEAFYGKTIEPKLQTILVEIQNEYNLTVPQVVGLLTIYDFFSRITLYDAHVSNLRLRENRDAELKHLPQKTREFFMGYKSCSEMTQFFCPSNTARYSKKFAKKILK